MKSFNQNYLPTKTVMKTVTSSKTNCYSWRRHIQKQLKKATLPDYSETIKPFTINWTLYGAILERKEKTL